MSLSDTLDKVCLHYVCSTWVDPSDVTMTMLVSLLQHTELQTIFKNAINNLARIFFAIAESWWCSVLSFCPNKQKNLRTLQNTNAHFVPDLKSLYENVQYVYFLARKIISTHNTAYIVKSLPALFYPSAKNNNGTSQQYKISACKPSHAAAIQSQKKSLSKFFFWVWWGIAIPAVFV